MPPPYQDVRRALLVRRSLTFSVGLPQTARQRAVKGVAAGEAAAVACAALLDGAV